MALVARNVEEAQIDVTFLDEAQTRKHIEQALFQLGLTYSELEEQAALRSFESDQAQRTWLAIQGLVD